ncbi:MAG TPA: universal stress protein [Rhizomicrobium sp.]|jgi:nucleotide-binding universal stress UspA family protein|nr:universal stress protein [Rhizomicrobium sp.]
MAGPRIRKFLVVIDKTPECQVALRFATRRAQHTGGRVTLMCAAKPGEFQQWRGVEEIMKDEAHAEAEALLHAAAKVVNDLSGILPELVISYGAVNECLAKLLKEDKDISILVLASGAGKEGPGPLVARFASAVQAIPVTIVPGTFTEEQIDALA